MSDISSDEEEEETTKESEPVIEPSAPEPAVAVEEPPQEVEEEASTIELIKKEIHESNEKPKTSENPVHEAVVKSRYSSEEEIPSDSESQPDEKVAAKMSKVTKPCEPVKLEPIVLQKSRINGASNRHEPTVRFRPTFSPEREEVIEKPELDIKKETPSQVCFTKFQDLTFEIKEEPKSDLDRTRSVTSDADSMDRLESISQKSSESSSKNNYVLTDISPPAPPSKRRSKELAPPPPPSSSSSRRKERRSSSNSSSSRHNLPMPPQPASRREGRVVAKGKSLKEALEYTPAARKT
jgi:hypothetical protein